MKDVFDVIVDLNRGFVMKEFVVVNPGGSVAVDVLLDLIFNKDELTQKLVCMYPGVDVFGGIEVLVGKFDKDLGSIKTQMIELMTVRGISVQDQKAFFRVPAILVRSGMQREGVHTRKMCRGASPLVPCSCHDLE